MTASVRLQVARRFGQRTRRNSIHAPLKYPPIARKGLVHLRGFLSFGIFLTVTFVLVVLAVEAALVAVFATRYFLFFPLKKTAYTACQVKCTPNGVFRQETNLYTYRLSDFINPLYYIGE